MAYTVDDYYRALDKLAPFASAEPWDNVGLLVGSPNSVVTAALVTLDLTAESIQEAKKIGANLIITHHPVIFPSIKRINSTSLLYELISSKINVISAHTSLDKAENGVNAALAECLGLGDIRVLESAVLPHLGRIGVLETTMTAPEFAKYVKSRLNVSCVKYTVGSNVIKTVAVGGGSCAELWRDAQNQGATAFVTAEVKHHIFLEARNECFTLIDAGHYATEVVSIKPLAEQLLLALPQGKIIASTTQVDPVSYA